MANIQTKNGMSEAFQKEKAISNTVAAIPDGHVENLTIQDMITEFPKLVREGQFVNAMDVIQGNGNFHWFFTLIEKANKRFFCESETPESVEKLELPIGPEAEIY